MEALTLRGRSGRRIAIALALATTLFGSLVGAAAATRAQEAIRGAPGKAELAAPIRASGSPGASSARRAPITPHGHRPFVPAVGDWEGTGDGYPASFELLYKPTYVVFRRPPYGFEDLTLIEPSTCPLAPDMYFYSVTGEHAVSPLGPGGSFPLASSGIAGGVRGPSNAILSTKFDSGAGTGNSACRGTLTWAMHPASRRRVDDGTWTLRFADGESQTITVSAGGRLVTGISFPSALSQCGGPSGGVNLFVAASGTATISEPHGAFALSLSFTAKAATGQITARPEGCGAFALAMNASLTKPAA